jgi:hypothetical protein
MSDEVEKGLQGFFPGFDTRKICPLEKYINPVRRVVYAKPNMFFGTSGTFHINADPYSQQFMRA